MLGVPRALKHQEPAPRDRNDFCIYAFLFMVIVVSKQFGTRDERAVVFVESQGLWGKGKLWWLIRKNRIESDCDCLHLARQGRWANNVFQLLQSTLLARVTQISRIYVPDDFMMLETSFNTTNGIQIIKGEPPPELKCVKDKFYFHFPEMPPLNASNVNWFRDTYMRQFANISLPKDALVMHVRSGDIFTLKRKFAYLNYEQPPCKYYEDVMRWRNWSQVLLLSQDSGNPCVPYLVSRGAHWRRRSVVEDLTVMLNAHNLVTSKGTFGMAVALLSYHLRNMFTFNMDGVWMMGHWNCEPTEVYQREMIDKWTQSRRQKRILVTGESCSRWTYLKRERPEQWLFTGRWAP